MGDQHGFLKMLLEQRQRSVCDFEAYVSGSFSCLQNIFKYVVKYWLNMYSF